MKYLALLLLSLPLWANALELDLGAGFVTYDHPDNGWWYQEEFDHSIDNESPTGRVGVRYKNFTLGIAHMGTGHTWAMATPSDQNYDEWRAGEAELWPLAEFEGDGRFDSLYLTYDLYLTDNLYITAGAHRTRVKWSMQVYNWRGAPDWPTGDTLDLSSRDYRTDYIYGAGWEHESWRFYIESWDISTDSEVPTAFGGRATNVGISYIINL